MVVLEPSPPLLTTLSSQARSGVRRGLHKVNEITLLQALEGSRHAILRTREELESSELMEVRNSNRGKRI